MTTYKVRGAAAIVRFEDTERMILRGAVVPDGALSSSLEHLLSVGLIEAVPAAAPPDDADDEVPTGDPSDAWTVKQLQAYAKAHGRDLGGARAKADILTALAAPAVPLPAATAPAGDGDGSGAGDSSGA